MDRALCLFDAALLAGAGSLMSLVLQAQSYAEAGLASLAIGLIGAGVTWITG
jgi:hypothetical protein